MSLVINPLGDTLALGAAFVWALYSIVLNKLSVYKAPILVSTRTIFGYGLIFIVAGVLYADDFRYLEAIQTCTLLLSSLFDEAERGDSFTTRATSKVLSETVWFNDFQPT